MFENTKTNVISSTNGVNYYVTAESDNSERPFGIYAVMENDPGDNGFAENIFFTEDEAKACCKWLAENEVFPVTLREVLENLYHL